MGRKKILQEYTIDEIHQALYHSNIPKTLWEDEKYEIEQLFIEHSVGNLEMLQVPLIWIPIVRKLMLELIEVNPDIHFFQIEEKAGELKVLTKFSHFYESQMLFGAKEAINEVTLIQLKLLNRIKQ